MKRTLIIALAATTIVLALAVAAPATAAPVEQCGRSGTAQFDMAGTYSSSTMFVRVYPCDRIDVQWTNAYGRHAASYDTGLHASDGILAELISAYGLDNLPYLSVKAAEPGYVQVWTIDASFNVVNSYRLRKTS